MSTRKKKTSDSDLETSDEQTSNESNEIPQDLQRRTKALKKYTTLATALKQEAVRHPGGYDFKLVLLAAMRMVQQVQTDLDLLREHLPKLFKPEWIEELEELTLALKAAQQELEQKTSSVRKSAIKKWEPQARRSRGKLLKYIEDLWPGNAEVATEEARIREGRGLLDLAHDCLDLVKLYQDREDQMDSEEQIDMKSAYKKQVKLADQAGTELLKALSLVEETAMRLRNGIWTLFLQRYEKLQRQGLFVSQELELQDPLADDRYPPLGRVSRRPSTSKQGEDTEPGGDTGAITPPTDNENGTTTPVAPTAAAPKPKISKTKKKAKK